MKIFNKTKSLILNNLNDNIQKIALTTFILSYTLFLLAITIDDSNGTTDFLFFSSWILGIISFISNFLLAEKMDINKWLTILLVLGGILWVFPPLLITYFGFPCMIIFVGIAIFIHIKAIKMRTKKLRRTSVNRK